MKRNHHTRKFLAWTLCLVMLVSVALPVLAAPEEEAPAAPAVEIQEPAPVKEEAPAKDETPAKAEEPVKDEAPAKTGEPVKDETPAKTEEPVKDEAPAKTEEPVKDETPAEDEEPVKDETPAETGEPVKDEAPAETGEPVKDETPAKTEEPVKEETPAEDEEPVKEETPAEDEEPVKDETPAKTEEPVKDETPAETGEPTPSTRPSATLFSAGGAQADTPDHGFSFDWSQEELQDSGWGSKLGVVKTSRGYYLYFDTEAYGEGALNVQTSDHPNSWDPVMSFITVGYDPEHLLNGADGRSPWTDEDIELHHYTSGDRRFTEAFVPAELLPEGDFTLSCNNAAFPFAASGVKAGDGDEEVEPTPEPVYTGIVIDGQFDDWAAVPRYDIDDGKNFNTVDQVSVVWDGDWVYILLVAEGDRDWEGNLTGMGNWASVTGGGTHGNGQYAITTDLGRTMLIQPITDNYYEPAVAGVDGAKAAVNNKKWEAAPHLWELAIPASELPEYLETINFGFYLSEPTITGISNMQDVGGGVNPFAANVVIDGKYNDWVGYPHSLIQYDRQGIQHHEVDGEAALWSDSGMLYGHVVTEHPDHLDEKGSCFLGAISIAFNGDRSVKAWPADGNFYPRILAIAEDGSVTDYMTVNDGHSTPNGTYTYYIFDTRTDPVKQFGHEDENGVWHDATAADLKANAFGTMKVTVTGTKDDMEFDLDLRRVADYIGADAGDFKTIEAQFGRIGQQWVTTAGTPTGPVLGVALAVGAVGAPMCYSEIKRRRAKGKDQGEAQDK